MILLAAVLSAWLQYAADGQPHARALATLACPSANVDGRALPMNVRAKKEGDFSDLVCDVAVPSSAKIVSVEKHSLPAPVRTLNTIVVLGDTGCRIKGLIVQDCSDSNAWPFASITRAIAKLHPDLIVHVGDYLYRELACPPKDTRCAGSPHGDTTQAWKADWFAPAAPLLSNAPLVLARGNHEDCERSWRGWFRYLDAHPMPSACEDVTKPYAVDFPGLRLVVFDTASGKDQLIEENITSQFQTAFEAAHKLASGPTWLVTHKPPYLNVNEREAMGDELIPFSAILAGHIHLFAGINVANLPPLIINGEGGDRLDTQLGPLLQYGLGNLQSEGKPFVASHFGFGLYTRSAQGWTITLRNPDGSVDTTCTLEKKIRC